jgi:hypothetical protein
MADDLWIDGPDDIANAPIPNRRHRRCPARIKLTGTWAKIPHDRGLELAKRVGSPVLAVLLALEHIIHDARSNRVKLTNGLLKQYGITRQSKTRGLRRLVAADVITVERGGGREAPIVTHRWYTKYGKLCRVRRVR